MARLEDLYPHFLEMDELQRSNFVHDYVARRTADINTYIARESFTAKASLSAEEKILLKKLGVSVKGLKTIASINLVEEDTGNDDDDELDIE
jgi:hypothetical protein